jgi:polyhydroxyalkanoate synthase
VAGPLATWAADHALVNNLVATPLAVATHLDDTEFLAQVEAVTRFREGVTAYPGRSSGQLYHRMLGSSGIASGSVAVGERTVELADLAAPTLVFAGTGDGIAPMRAVHPAVTLLSGAPRVRFEVVPGGHLGLLTGRGARASTWRILDEWLDTILLDIDDESGPMVTPPSAGSIGSNRTRRYASSPSRTLAPKPKPKPKPAE